MTKTWGHRINGSDERYPRTSSDPNILKGDRYVPKGSKTKPAMQINIEASLKILVSDALRRKMVTAVKY